MGKFYDSVPQTCAEFIPACGQNPWIELPKGVIRKPVEAGSLLIKTPMLFESIRSRQIGHFYLPLQRNAKLTSIENLRGELPETFAVVCNPMISFFFLYDVASIMLRHFPPRINCALP